MRIERLLGNEYLEECYAITLQKEKASGTIANHNKELFDDSFSQYFIENDSRYILACIDGDRIVSWVAVTFLDTPIRGRFWTISALYTTKFHGVFSFSNEEIGLLIKAAFELAESKLYFVYYYSIAERVEKVYERQWRKNPWGFNGRYEFEIVAVIDPMTKPESEFFWKLMGGTFKPDVMLIKRRTLNESEQEKIRDKYEVKGRQ